MKVVLLLCVLAAVVSAKRDTSKITLLKNKVANSHSIFSYDGFKNAPVGIMSVKVNIGKPQTISLTKAQQKPQWLDVTAASPLKSMGYNKWMSVKGGMVFKNAKAEMVECSMSGTKPLDTGKVVLDYSCKPMSKMRFAKAKATYWISGKNTETEVNSAWDTRWGPFDYPFYTTSSQGILGCKNTSGGYCTPQNADLFPFESCYANINDAGEAKAECEKKKKEKELKMNQLEQEVELDEKADAEDTAKFFGHNFEEAEKQEMHVDHKRVEQQQQQEHESNQQQEQQQQQEQHQQQQQQQQQEK